ncbi:hypothetical protein DMN91_009487 [Ooceraea biroi]|uniref:Secreted protein n=1 Tax=Ooceraea biroi TaxID=2015173 RepID=A0A026WU26_OOCBI|nr:uncharacterized protein LOC113562630 [Ooceraea biroi]EZA58594.1 hypothetical protein X777_14760 [Ooceraea biroi]RLU19129.1 hypothetical protein DMN91_009487 [Ooceraea biroi]
MKHLGNLFGLCFAILAGSILVSSTTIDASTGDAHDTKDAENHHISPSKLEDAKNNSECPSNTNLLKGVTQIGERAVKDPSHSNKVSNASTASFDSKSIETQHSKYIGDRKDDPFQLEHQQKAVNLSSHDILLDPALIRLVRQAEKRNADYPTHEDTSGNVESIDLSQRGSDLEDDLGVAEDRRQYPYWYRGQPTNQRYRVNDRREHYRNYLRYPVFPGK